MTANSRSNPEQQPVQNGQEFVGSSCCPITPEPIYPKPMPYTSNFGWRLIKGLKSWLALLSDLDFRIPIGSVELLGTDLFLVNEPQTVKRLMVDDVANFPKHPLTLWILEPLIGRAIFSVNGEEWERQRRLLDQAFQAAQLRRVLPQMQGAVGAMLKRLDAVVNTRHKATCIEIDDAMTLVTADVIVRTILSRPLDEEDAAEIFKAFARYQRRAGRALILRLLQLPEKQLTRYLRRHAKTIRDWLSDAIDLRLNSPQKQVDLLQSLIDAVDERTGSRFSRDELLDQVCFLFLAGHETSASALGMAIYLLSCYPTLQQRLRAEVMDLESAGPLDFDDLKRLPYATAFFNETLRLYPPVSFFIRESLRDTNLIDRRCPMHSLVTISPWVVQRQEGQWSQPNGFNPERFLSSATSAKERQLARDAWLPFGLGPRKCPGAAFALQEALLVLAEIVKRYELLPASGANPELVGRLTLRSRNGIRVKIKRLDAAYSSTQSAHTGLSTKTEQST